MVDVVFFGTPQFAVPCLEALAHHPNFKILAVVTQPDKPKGRHLKPGATPVATCAERLGLPVLKLERFNHSNVTIQQFNHADIFVVVAYGVIVPKYILAIPKYGTINLHPSLLPKYRGASPIQAAILNADQETGVTLMLLDEELDHGPILGQETVPIEHHDTYETLSTRLSAIGAKLLLATLPLYLKGTLKPKPQDHTQATFTKQLSKDDGRIYWSKSALAIERMVRAFTPWPGAWTMFKFKGKSVRLKVIRATANVEVAYPAPEQARDRASIRPLQTVGMINALNSDCFVVCGNQTYLRLDIVQPAGKKPMSGREFLNGYVSVKQLQ